ncbi:lipase 1 [Drosophila teissieri]|uniref:lipase 1 n=1 Tax=Drosophila teissieri TaxID=7243 RepID=UPI001CB9F15E|nr:lipase 1 [Drosophila teissieri]XP_043662470.1 lipase 1 [Drosophila teissieri]
MPHAIWFLLVLGVYALDDCGVLGGYMEDNYPASVIEDARLNTIQLLQKYKHPAETHQVTTDDKYILTLHRIARPGAKPVLLVHGLEDSSSTWIVMGPESGLGYFLYANGYDVWMGNVRGNRYSKGHVKLNPNTDKSYWTFSWHEIGMYDLPAMIDGVLQKTGYQKLSYFGHSQGTTSFFVMTSSRPEYNAKIHLMSALAPVAFMRHMKAPLMGMARMGMNMFSDNFELFPHSDIFLNHCLTSSSMLKTCMRFYWQIVGKNREEQNMTMFPVVLGHLPGGANIKQAVHYLQLQKSDRFCQYEYEPKENHKLYGRSTPPDYRLERISAPVALYYGSNDYLAAVEDVQRLAKVLPNVVENHLYRKWNHMDMIWGISARRSIQPRILQVMQYWEAGGAAKDATTGSPVEEDVTQLTTETPIEEGKPEEAEEEAGIGQGNEENEGHAEETEQVNATTSPTSEL